MIRILPPLCVLILSLSVYFVQFGQPDGLFWDENYHIASAQKYIDGVMFMEPHPPLGKLVIAAGEALFGPNRNLDTSYFDATDYVNVVPDGFSFSGVRFFPSLFAAACALLVYFILLRLMDDWKYALAFSTFYLFDNALIVHLRGAMLEGIQIFFILAAVLVFILILQKKKEPGFIPYILFGLLTGLALAVKVNAAILLLCFPFFAVEYVLRHRGKILCKKNFPFIFLVHADKHPVCFARLFRSAGRLAARLGAGLLTLLVAFLLPFYIHFALGKTVIDDRYYGASPEYRRVLENSATAKPINFIPMLTDYVSYMDDYQRGVPGWEPSRPDENGSPPVAWPLGYKAINYRWTRTGNVASYLYLQINPFVWYPALLGLLLAVIFVGARPFLRKRLSDPVRFRLIVWFLLLYFGYMIAMAGISRVLYLYHYFIPLLFSVFVSALLFRELFREFIGHNNKLLVSIAFGFALLVCGGFLFFSPLTYYLPLDTTAFMQRVWTDLWGLIPVTK